MNEIDKNCTPDREAFKNDPFGYSALAWYKWANIQINFGIPIDITKPPTSNDLKAPILWMSQAHALSEAAILLLKNEPGLNIMPKMVHGICDCQYCAIGLMLMGYSLEICLKAMIIQKKGIIEYSKNEKKYMHHRLEHLSDFIPALDSKDIAILKALTHFTYWAGRYPDPGSGRDADAENIFTLAEGFKITAHDLFELAGRIMSYSTQVFTLCNAQQT